MGKFLRVSLYDATSVTFLLLGFALMFMGMFVRSVFLVLSGLLVEPCAWQGPLGAMMSRVVLVVPVWVSSRENMQEASLWLRKLVSGLLRILVNAFSLRLRILNRAVVMSLLPLQKFRQSMVMLPVR